MMSLSSEEDIGANFALIFTTFFFKHKYTHIAFCNTDY